MSEDLASIPTFDGRTECARWRTSLAANVDNSSTPLRTSSTVSRLAWQQQQSAATSGEVWDWLRVRWGDLRDASWGSSGIHGGVPRGEVRRAVPKLQPHLLAVTVGVDDYRGQHLWVWRSGYTHHGIGDGEGGVIHYAGLAAGFSTGPICRVTLDEFANGAELRVREHRTRRFSCDEAVARAQSRLGESSYSVAGNNCEHFVRWCITGVHHSVQSDRVAKSAGGVLSGGAARGAITVVASQGAAGLSGSGVMSGLASVGGLVGGGAVAGLGVLGGTGGLGAAVLLNNSVLKDAECLPPEEREARAVARKATYAGAALGTAGGIAAVSAAGTTAGLGAAGITSGLAAIGGTVGGGMAAGTMLVAAAPVAAAFAVGIGVHRLWKWVAA